MLFSYAPEGFHDNWLHEALLGMVLGDIDRVDGAQPSLAWPTCIDVEYRERLQTRTGLRNRRQALLAVVQNLSAAERGQVRGAIARQNDLPALFGDNQPCDRLGDLPPAIRQAVKDLFEFAFSILADLGLRDQNYQRIYDGLKYKVCAFCGVEILDAPAQKREALDHYLPIAIYPFAGANFKNLAPMGGKCNSRYKLQQDIIIDAAGQRRPCCDPYNSPSLSLSLNDSQPFEGERVDLVQCPDWVIHWDGGEAAKLATWEAVFGVADRYRASILNPNFRDWLDHFGQWAARKPGAFTTQAGMRQALLEFAELVVPEGWADSAFLKRSTIRMLAHRCDTSEAGNRLVEWLADLVGNARQLQGVGA